MKIVAGQVAVLTGGASGIGLALAVTLAARGVRLVIADIEQARLDTVAVDLSGEVLALRCDVAQPEQVEALRDAALGRFGQVDLVFNNAGVVLPFRPMWEHPAEDWDWLLGINLGGVINGIRSFVPHLVAQGRGHLINTASMAGVSVIPFNGVYNASKHAIVSLTETLAGELAARAPGVRASVVCPGLVPTRIAPRGSEPVNALDHDAIAPAAALNVISAEDAAARILAGVERDALYIFTNPHSVDSIAARNDAIIRAAQQ